MLNERSNLQDGRRECRHRFLIRLYRALASDQVPLTGLSSVVCNHVGNSVLSRALIARSDRSLVVVSIGDCAARFEQSVLDCRPWSRSMGRAINRRTHQHAGQRIVVTLSTA